MSHDAHGHNHDHHDHGHGHGHHHEKPRKLTPQEMRDHQIPLLARDNCAALLIPLNKCRLESFALPWKCGVLKEEYRHCQKAEWEDRVLAAQQKKLQELRLPTQFVNKQ